MHKVRVTFFLFFLIFSVGLVAYPEYDLQFSSIFHDEEGGFLYHDDLFVSFVFRSIPFASKLFASICVMVLLYKLKSPKNIIKSPVIFLILSLAIGPGLIVNYGFKENFGRARPKEIIEFGGTKEFSSAAIITDQCRSNCSFSSGHAAMGYYFTVFAWIAPFMLQNLVFFTAFLFGTGVGLGRIIQGGHFLSDITFSFVIVILANELCYRFWIYLNKKTKEENAFKE